MKVKTEDLLLLPWTLYFLEDNYGSKYEEESKNLEDEPLDKRQNVKQLTLGSCPPMAWALRLRRT